MSYSDGRVSDDDLGDLYFQAGIIRHPETGEPLIMLRFPKPVDWLGGPVAETRQLIAELTRLCDEAEGGPTP